MIRLLSLVAFTAGCGRASVELNSDDQDGDGLGSDEEAQYGSDPALADTDGDVYDDGVEVASFTDPTDADDHPYEGGWTIDSCRNDVVSTGMAVGNIAPQFELEDQFGETVRLHDFCGKAVLLVLGAEWCGPCQEKAATMEAVYAQYKDDGFIAIEILGETLEYTAPSQSTLQNWADAYGLSIPVLSDPAWAATSAYMPNGTIPAETLIKPGGEILVVDGDGESMISAALP
jgi:peroxiredoxin